MPYFQFNNVRLHYEVCGNGPPLLLINGLGADTRQWLPLTELLKDSFQIVCYDMRCAGRSAKPREQFTVCDLSNEAVALLDHLEINKSYILGFSMGGMIAIDIAANHPEKVAGLILLSTSTGLHGTQPAPKEAIELFRRTDISPELLTEVYNLIFGPAFKERNSLQQFVDFRMSDDEAQPADAYLNQLAACETIDVSGDVAKIKTPTLVITGTADRVIPPGNSTWLKETIRGSKLVTLDGVGHMTPLEAPDGIVSEIKSTFGKRV